MKQSTLRVGAINVHEREAMLLRGLIRLNGYSEQGKHWEFVDQAPYDLLFVDPLRMGHDERMAVSCTAPTVCIVNADAAHEANSLQRPFTSDALIHWFERARAHAISKPAQTVIPKQVEPQAHTAVFDVSVQFKLLKWPPMTVLRGDPARIRMATMLARQALRIKELAQLAQQPLDQVQQFIDALHRAGILLVAQTMPTAKAQVPVQARSLQAKPAAGATMRGLLSQIRQKLGLMSFARA